MPIVQTDVPTTSALCAETLRRLAERYPFCRLTPFGTSTFGRPLLALTLGTGPRRVLYSAAHHANEWITAPVLLKFAEDVASAAENGTSLLDTPIPALLEQATICLVPMVNPDGVDLVTGAVAPGSVAYETARFLSQNYPAIPFPDGWKADLLGVDLNLQYPAGWLEAREIKFAQGYSRPGPRDYVGRAPLTQPEPMALRRLTLELDPALVLAYHTQGEVIYWQFRDLQVTGAEALGRAFAAVSGYTLADTPYESSFAGYKDWFIQRFRRPGYTVEVGQGTNPLPLSQFDTIYRENLGILLLGAAGLVSEGPSQPQDAVT